MGVRRDIGRVAEGDYVEVAVSLLPPGPAWPRFLETGLRKVLGAFCREPERIHNRGLDLVEESDPRTATETIAAWEREYGLPEKCLHDPPSTIEGRRAAVHAKAISQGGQTAAYFISIAAALGHVITIEEPFPFCAEESCADDPCYDDAWAFAYIVNESNAHITAFRSDSDGNHPLGAAGEPLMIWEDTELECALWKVAPSHAVLVFFYDEAEFD